jgi:Rod binding domain-containing protein
MTNPIANVSAPGASQAETVTTASEGARAKARDAARDFEAIFVRQLLQPLEKMKSMSGKSDAGSPIYGSMLVGALADAATRGAGFGLADLIATALTPAPTAAPRPSAPTPGSPDPAQSPEI